MLRLKVETDPRWVEVVMGDLGAFLIDHAYCERKASSSALKMLVSFPERKELVNAMLDLSREELEHFVLVYRQIEARGLLLTPDGPDEYVNRLARATRGKDPLLDKLLLSAMIEGRSCERFILLEAALPEGELKTLYQDLIRSEARHHGLFLRLAKDYYSEEIVERRLDEVLALEAEIIKTLPLRPVVH